MKLCKHICFYYNDSLYNRISYLQQLISISKTYSYETDIYIHTNDDGKFDLTCLNTIDTNTYVVYHKLENEHPFFLSWKPRELMKTQKYDYDIFLYVEDDILIKNDVLNYWMKYKNKVMPHQYNLGFVRIEVDKNGKEYCTDLFKHLTNTMIVEHELYSINNINIYCGTWILDKVEFQRYVDSQYYELANIHSPQTLTMCREMSAWGLNAPPIKWYTNVVIPIENGKLHPHCRIYHLPNNYIDSDEQFASILFDDIISST